jgi:UDP-glucose 4-epimerase
MALYVVTGGAGFIGSHLVDSLLLAGHTLRVVDDFSTGKQENLDRRADILVADISAAGVMEAALEGAAGCFHLAAIASVQRANEDWVGTHRVNQAGSVAVLDACRARRVPVVYASSAAVYGDTGGAVADEGMICRPQTAYGADKLGSELHASVGWGVHGMPSFGLRFFNVYGPRQDPASPYSGVISIFAARIRRGEALTVHGDGLQSRDFVFVDDVIGHAWAAMEVLAVRPGAWVSNVCTGVETSVLQLAEALGQVIGVAPRIETGPARAGDIRRSVGSTERAVASLGVRARVGLEEGLARLVKSLDSRKS